MPRKSRELPVPACPEDEALSSAIGNGEHWSVVSERLRALGWALTAIPGANVDEPARVFKGFPIAYEDDQRKIWTFRQLANLLERGDLELTVFSAVIKYYVATDAHEDGYELRTGHIANLRKL